MLYRFITSGYTDLLAYATAFLLAVWFFISWQYSPYLPDYLAVVSPSYGLAVAAFSGALLICKYICLDGNSLTVRVLNVEKSQLAQTIKSRDMELREASQNIAQLTVTMGELQNKISVMEANSPDRQLSEMRIKLRNAEDDKVAALSVLLKNLQTRVHAMMGLPDEQLHYAADVLRQEIGLVDNEIKRGVFSYYELCIKIVDISEKLTELNDINLVSSLDQTAKADSVTEAWLNFIKVNDNTDPAAIERSFKFFKVAFHPDRFPSETLKVEAAKYFKHSINVHSSVKRLEKSAP